ncbi:hypothetical protein ABT112_31695 [Streptomyces sp. NPDC002055]|uniref:hypothetical protein n=1 Tax=Streptomyces sp. NPDC002055 TaxID=3154534 RepID=UPI00332D901C
MATSSSALRAPMIVMLSLLAAFLTSGCAVVNSPPRHSERLQKASGLKVFQVDTTKELWEKTSEQIPYDQREAPIDAKTKRLNNGLLRIQLSGVSLANYMRQLDSDAHGGPGSGAPWARSREAESIRMYDEISGVLDGITKRPGPKEPPLRVVVDDAFIDAKHTASPK